MGRRKNSKALKQFDAYIEGDGDLRKEIFAETPASQQAVFELFAQLDHVYYSFFLHFCSIPSVSLWDIFLTQLAAIASGSARNRNFCEDYDFLESVEETRTCYSSLKDKAINLVGSSHALWFELADPNYSETPDTHAIWTALWTLNPNRMVWEWWFEGKAREINELYKLHGKNINENSIYFENWGRRIGLLDYKNHWFSVAQKMRETYRLATDIKHRIANPYLRLVYTVTKSIAAYNQPEQFFDTFNIACAGLMRAIAKYAPSMSMAFANFADREVRYEIYYQLSNYNIVSLPHKSWQKYREYEELKRQYFEEYRKDPTLEELIKTYKLCREDVYDIYQQIAMQSPQSLDQKVYKDEKAGNQVTLKDRIEDSQILENQELLENQEAILLSLKRMNLQDRKIFIALNNTCDFIHEFPPLDSELHKFFFGENSKVAKMTKSPTPFLDAQKYIQSL